MSQSHISHELKTLAGLLAFLFLYHMSAYKYIIPVVAGRKQPSSSESDNVSTESTTCQKFSPKRKNTVIRTRASANSNSLSSFHIMLLRRTRPRPRELYSAYASESSSSCTATCHRSRLPELTAITPGTKIPRLSHTTWIYNLDTLLML